MKRGAWWLALAAAWITGCGLLYSATQHAGAIAGIYWAITTATTVGYGDQTVHGTGGQLLAIGTMLTAIPLLAASYAVINGARVGQRIHELDKRITEHHRAVHERFDRLEEQVQQQGEDAKP